MLEHLKTLQHVSIIIQIIFREFVGSLLSSLNLNIPLHTERHTPTPNIMLPHHHNWPFTFLKIFKFTDFNKEPASSLKMIWIMIESCWSVFKCFNILDYYIIVYRSALVGM